IKDPHLPKACEAIAALAESRFSEAEAALGEGGTHGLRPARIMMTVYRRLLGRLRRRGWDRLDEPVRIPSWERAWIALRHLVSDRP
ncbi:MAG: squalene synthase HpnD, partial [Rhodospirillales bacterium]|nr:squalene synthase HpnD [Rhodospirillales bacterium]